ncbi:MAG: SDR family oxidoreductase [Deltaproteobacteria bacterium]|nr:SDR family oxidoreductase [Deltaproteobacteria bacterium]
MTTRGAVRNVALVTGAARRVGKAISCELAAHGMAVAVHFHASSAEADALVADLVRDGRVARAFQGDLARPADCDKLIDDVLAWQGRLDVLCNNASVFRKFPFTGGDDREWEDAWRDSLDVNLLAPARLVRRAAPALSREGGVVVNLLDIGAWQAWPGFAHYGVAKAGLAWLTKTLAVALAPHVRVVGVAPGIAEFPEDMNMATRARLVAAVPLARAGTPEDIAQAVRYLVGANYVNGTVLVVDGGRLARGSGPLG